MSGTFQEDTADRPYLPLRSFHLHCTFQRRRQLARDTHTNPHMDLSKHIATPR